MLKVVLLAPTSTTAIVRWIPPSGIWWVIRRQAFSSAKDSTSTSFGTRPAAVTAAARFAERFSAAASYHGVPLVTDKPDSPHRVAGQAKAELYFAFGEMDHLTPAKDVETLRAALEKTAVRHEIEMYEGGAHGFVFPQRASYHKANAERHWERLFDLFRRRLA